MNNKVTSSIFALSLAFATNASASVQCADGNRAATSEMGLLGHQVVLFKNEQVIFDSNGFLTGTQADSTANSFCNNGTIPPTEVNVTKSAVFPTKELKCKNTGDNNINATAELGWTSASYALSNGKKRAGDISYNEARASALEHCAGPQ